MVQQVGAESPELEDVMLRAMNTNITYYGSEHPVIHSADFELYRGESVLFLGPSGCGKSTFAMMCARLIPQSVEAQVSGDFEWDESLSKPGNIGYVFQDPDAQFCQLTVADEIAFGLENRRVPQSEMDGIIGTALKTARLDVPFQANHAVFSGGMKQKLAIASALALHPDLLVLDEPTANLDPMETRAVFDLIAELKTQGQTMIVIEHKFERLLDVIDRVVLFTTDGTIHRTGPTNEIIRDEWQWLVNEGVIPPWKPKPGRSLHVEKSGYNKEPGVKDKDDQNKGQLDTLNAYRDSASAHGVDSAFQITNGGLNYGRQTVLRNLSLDIPAGQFTAIVGPNGAGKSSLLQVLAGLVKLSEGNLKLLGRDSAKWRTTERYQRLSYSFQNPEFQFVYEQVGDELANCRVKGEFPSRVRALLDEFGLGGMEHQSPFALSQGQKRRLSVAAMLREDHDAYLLDEPTFGQDARTQGVIVHHLRRLVEMGKTVVFTTHDMQLVKQLAEHVIVIDEGKVLFAGPPAELFQRLEILKQGHLLDDQVNEFDRTVRAGEDQKHRYTFQLRTPVETPLSTVNPAFLLLALMAAGLVSLLTNTLVNGALIFGLAVVLMIVPGRVNPLRIAKWLLPFVLFYLLYIWSFAAYAKVPPGTSTVNILWAHLSWQGLHQGEVLAMRMLASVAFSMAFVFTVDLRKLIVALTVNLRVPPKFSYGTLAGFRVIPLFQHEWSKLRKARELRGKAGMMWFRPITYALPLLSQAVRMSERVAIAMEARGFVGAAARSPEHRSYYHPVKVRWYDYVVLVFLPLASLVLLYV